MQACKNSRIQECHIERIQNYNNVKIEKWQKLTKMTKSSKISKTCFKNLLWVKIFGAYNNLLDLIFAAISTVALYNKMWSFEINS